MDETVQTPTTPEVPVEPTTVGTPGIEGAPKTPVCDSCGQDKPLTDVPHAQEGNPHVWHYCATCKFAHDVEAEVVKLLKVLAGKDPVAANDPKVVGDIRSQVTAKLLEAGAPDAQTEVTPAPVA